MRSKIAMVLIAFILPISGAKADIASDLESFWGSLSGTSNLTGATAFEGQAAGYYTLGNLRARAQSRSSSLTSFNLPSVEAGCGGIDLFAGSFSIISADEIVQLSRAIASNAVGFAFDLALETVSPVISETMKNLRAQLQELNLNNINSCEAAKGIVSSIWPKQALARDKICAELGTSKGIFTDYAASRHECGTPKGQQQANDAADPDEIDTLPENVNIAWELMRGKNFASSDWLKSDAEMAQFAQTLTGTVIKKGDAIEYFRPLGLIQAEGKKDYLYLIVFGGSAATFNLYTCRDDDECLEIIEVSKTISENQSLRSRVRTRVSGIITKIKNNTALTDEERGFVNATQLPIYRILNVYAAYSGSIINTETDTLVDILAIGFAIEWIEGLALEVRSRASLSELSGNELVVEWLKSLDLLIMEVNKLKLENIGKFNRALDLTERVQLIEATLGKNIARSFGNVVNTNQASQE